jgi:hypothetical protein
VAATYFSRAEKALRIGATTVVAGRLQSTVPVGIADLANPADTRSIDTDYELFGPGDVQRLAVGAIVRRFPAPGSSDAEQPKVALIEFSAVDLPWRYTPRAAAGAVLRPWLVLVVGRRTPDEIVLRPDGQVGLGTATQQVHALADSSQWAHVHDVDGRRVARLLSPAPFAQETEYVACLVPAFTADGADAWTGTAPVTCPCYDTWTFRTGPLGDFPELAAKLHKADLAAIDAAGGTPFGRADVTYLRRGPGDPDSWLLSTAGALRLPADPVGGPDPADQPPPPDVTIETTHLSDRIVTPDGRGVVTAPRYDAPFVTLVDQETFTPGGWIDELRGDPRARGAAGLGAWNAIEWQDRIADAATTKLAGLSVADDRIRHVALGVEASRSVWRRRVPTLAAAADLLAVLLPVLGRLPTDGGTVLDAVAGHTPGLSRALFSSAARRALRPGPARTARAADGAADLGAVLRSANRCPAPADDPADIPPRRDVDPRRVEEATKTAVEAAADGDEDLAGRILDRLLGAGRPPSPADLTAALLALAPGKDGRPDRAAVQAFLNTQEHPVPTTQVSGWTGWVDEFAPPTPCEPVDLTGLAGAVAGAVDPTVEQPPAVLRVLATLPGRTGIGPVEVEPELDLPLWSFLSASAPDWMLPGAGDLIEGDVVALATNPAFVEALLAGANQQTSGELRWRNIPLVTRWSPLRKFWQRSSGQLDILPIKNWPQAQPLGGPALVDGGHAAEAVVAFKTPLFRRYPSTVVYLYAADAAFTPPGAGDVLVDANRVEHVFTGTIGSDITFFGFPIDPGKLADYWVVLEEPPAGYRFFEQSAALVADSSAANYAFNRFALPVRVLIGPLL